MILFAGFLFAGFLCAGCQTKAECNLENSGRATLRVDSALGAQMGALLRNMASEKINAAAPVFDAALIDKSLKENKNIEKSSWTQNGPLAVHGEIVIKKIDSFIPKDVKNVISLKQGALSITIDRKNGAAVLAAISPDLTDYLSAIMAPLATGEELTKKEYFELVAGVYSAALAKEIENARFVLRLNLPSELRSVKGGVKQRRAAVFNTALADILVLEKPIIYEASWYE